ncbi:hypothetical protein LCGC14_0720380 [marine sediment metagenome]|uniref:Uncharacterized protein n=1 Tax=marine sediment metagenome TaxID=412755 RepID=A0A0F9QCJ5_9ZZZZ
MSNSVKLQYADLYTYLVFAIDYDGVLKKMLIEETIKRFGSIENFLRKIGKGEIIDKLKEQMLWEN